MGLGLGLLRLESHAFWSLTPAEFAACARTVLGPAATRDPLPGRRDLASLMSRFPDQS